jgi:hypothetical protein
VKIWGHYAVIDGEDAKFYRHLIAEFSISPTEEGDQRWKAFIFVRNVYDKWLPEHFKRICSAIDMLPADLNFEVSAQSELHSGLSQQFEGYVVDEPVADGQQSARPITPDATTGTGTNHPKKQKKK